VVFLWSVLISALVLLSSVAEASFLRAYGLWPATFLRRVVVYKDPKKGSRLAFAVGAGGLYAVDVTDPFHPVRKNLTDDLPQPGQIQDLLLSDSGKKSHLYVADGSGGLCRFPVSGKGLGKPLCRRAGGFAYAVEAVGDHLLVATERGVELWRAEQKEWTPVAEVATPGQARDLALELMAPERLAPEPKEVEGEKKGSVPYTIGRIYVADGWGGLRVLEFLKVVTYEPVASDQQEGNRSSGSRVVAEEFVLKPLSAAEGDFTRVALAEGLIVAAERRGGVKIFLPSGTPKEVASIPSGELPEVKDLFLLPAGEGSFFLFVAAGRKGLRVYRLDRGRDFTVSPVAETLVSGRAVGIFVDEDYRFYLIDEQAGLFTGLFPDFIPLEVETNASDCRDFARAVIRIGDPGPLTGKPAFLCIWLEIPACEGATGLSRCKQLGFEGSALVWRMRSYVLVSPEERFFDWVEGRHCLPLSSLEALELEALRPEHALSCEAVEGGRLNLCLDVDADLHPDICTSAGF